METKQATRIQTSILNAVEKKVLVWLAERQPSWMTSDRLTFIGFLGAVIIALGFILSSVNINFLWLSSLGFVINWYGDSLDGTLARVRNCQRPLYGYYLDHTIDGINESIMLFGLGISPLMNLPFALGILVLYLLLTINVSVNAHLKQEFRLTYIKLGPTEFRLIAIIIITLYILIRPFREFSKDVRLCGYDMTLHAFDYAAIVIIAILLLIYFVTIFIDAHGYAQIDPPKKQN